MPRACAYLGGREGFSAPCAKGWVAAGSAVKAGGARAGLLTGADDWRSSRAAAGVQVAEEGARDRQRCECQPPCSLESAQGSAAQRRRHDAHRPACSTKLHLMQCTPERAGLPRPRATGPGCDPERAGQPACPLKGAAPRCVTPGTGAGRAHPPPAATPQHCQERARQRTAPPRPLSTTHEHAPASTSLPACCPCCTGPRSGVTVGGGPHDVQAVAQPTPGRASQPAAPGPCLTPCEGRLSGQDVQAGLSQVQQWPAASLAPPAGGRQAAAGALRPGGPARCLESPLASPIALQPSEAPKEAALSPAGAAGPTGPPSPCQRLLGAGRGPKWRHGARS